MSKLIISESSRGNADSSVLISMCANAAINRIDRDVVVNLPLSGWSATAPYAIRVAVPGVKAADNPDLKVCTPKTLDAATVKLRQKLTGMITDGMMEDGYVTLYCGAKKPTADFPVLLKGVSVNG